MIDRAHLELWADMQSAQGDFPELIHRLVSASVTPYLEKCNIPFGSAVNLGGWDGEVDATQQTEYGGLLMHDANIRISGEKCSTVAIKQNNLTVAVELEEKDSAKYVSCDELMLRQPLARKTVSLQEKSM